MRENYVKPPAYCRSLCAARTNSSSYSSKYTHVHARKKRDGFVNDKHSKKRKKVANLPVANYKAGYVASGIFTMLPFEVESVFCDTTFSELKFLQVQ